MNVKEGKIQNVFPLSSLGISQSLVSDLSSKDPESLPDDELERKAATIIEEILKQRPELYPSDFGQDPGLDDARLSIKRQILRRFHDQVGEKPVLDIWRKGVDLDFVGEAPFEVDALQQVWDPVSRPENLKQQDYKDARESIERRRVEDMFRQMQQDPFFDSKLKDYFEKKHSLKVRDYYEHSMREVLQQGDSLDRRADGLVKNELMDFLMKYSDLKLGEESKVFFGLAALGADSQDAVSRFEEKCRALEMGLDQIDQAQGEKETFQRLISFERRFEDLKREAMSLKNHDQEGRLESTTSPQHDIKDLETRLNLLKDGGELGGLHQAYYEFDEYSTRVPFALDLLDFRQDPKEWVSRRVEEFVDLALEGRLAMEKFASREDLAKIDEDLARGLSPTALKRAVFRALEQELAIANELQRNYLKSKDLAHQISLETQKDDDFQRVFDRQIPDSPAKDRLFAFENSLNLTHHSTFAKMSQDKIEELHFTYEFLLEEASGRDYSYLLHQDLKDLPIRHGHDEYMTQEGFRPNRQVNNHFTARMMGQTVFEESSSSTHYLGAADTSLGFSNLQRPASIQENHLKFEPFMSLDDDRSEKSLLKGVTQAFTQIDYRNAVSKSLGWYFHRLNQRMINTEF